MQIAEPDCAATVHGGRVSLASRRLLPLAAEPHVMQGRPGPFVRQLAPTFDSRLGRRSALSFVLP